MWEQATSPRPVPRACSTRTVDEAYLSPSARGNLHTEGAPKAPRIWVSGAVHEADGALVRDSIRSWSGDRAAPVSVDPDRVRVVSGAERLEGTWRYAGNWTEHFGHFLVELLPLLWPTPQDEHQPLTGLVVHRSARGAGRLNRLRASRAPELAPWQRDLLRLAGYPDVPVRIVMNRPARVERLLVASPPVLLKYWAAPEAVALWRRVSDAVGERGAARRVFLSRSAFHLGPVRSARNRRTEAAWDEHLDRVFARAGFAVVHPEQLPVTEQLAIVRGADVLAGASGSALHLSAFAREGTRVLEVGDRRSPDTAMPSQRMIDAACGHRTAFVAHLDEKGLRRTLRSLE